MRILFLIMIGCLICYKIVTTTNLLNLLYLFQFLIDRLIMIIANLTLHWYLFKSSLSCLKHLCSWYNRCNLSMLFLMVYIIRNTIFQLISFILNLQFWNFWSKFIVRSTCQLSVRTSPTVGFTSLPHAIIGSLLILLRLYFWNWRDSGCSNLLIFSIVQYALYFYWLWLR